MARVNRGIPLLALAASLVPASDGAAETVVTSLRYQLLPDTPTIVIGRLASVAEGTYTLAVERALRGAVKRGHLVVKRSPEGAAKLPVGSRTIAFVNARGEWVAAGTAFTGTRLEDGVIRLAGFNDTGEHRITQGVVTLAEIERAIVKGTPMAWTFRGPIRVASPKGVVSTSFQLVAWLPSGDVNGVPNLVDFGAPTIAVGTSHDVEVTWNSPRHDRPLAIAGDVIGLNPDGSIAVRFRLIQPEVMTEPELAKYLADNRLGRPYYVLELDLGTRKLPVLIRDDGSGTVGSDVFSHVSNRDLATAGALTVLDATSYRATSRSVAAKLVEEAIAGPIGCRHTPTGGSQVPCTLRYVRTRFAKP
jgi:hypothetical protein